MSSHPTFDLILNHLGPSDYLKDWIRNVFHGELVERLDFRGPMCSGKSTFYRLLEVLGAEVGLAFDPDTDFDRFTSKQPGTVMVFELEDEISDDWYVYNAVVCCHRDPGEGIQVPPLQNPIPTGELLRRLKREAAAFLASLGLS